MKKLLLLPALFICFKLAAQNVGINTTTPQATLDVKGNQRVGGAGKFLYYDSLSGKISWNNSNLFVPAPQYLMQHSASAEGLFYGNSKLLYRGVTDTAFYTDWNTGNGYFRSNLGIGVLNPANRLQVGYGTVRIEGPASAGGVAMSVGGYGDVQVDAVGIAGGRFILKQNGNVGIGINNPNATLDVMRGTAGGGTAQFWGTQHITHINLGVDEDTYIRAGRNNRNVILNDIPGGKVGIGTNAPGFPLNFASTLGDKIALWGNAGGHYGFGIQSGVLQIHTDLPGSDIAFGHGSSSSFTERFRMKGTGGLVVNGNEGQSSQVLRSNGSGQPASWVNPLNALYNNMYEYSQAGTLTINPLGGSVIIPGMSSISLVISSRSKVIFSSAIDVRSNGCFACGGSTASLLVQVNTPGGGVLTGGKADGSLAYEESRTFVTGMKVLTLNPGTYTVHVRLYNGNISGPSITGSFGWFNYIVVQE